MLLDSNTIGAPLPSVAPAAIALSRGEGLPGQVDG